MYSVNAASLEGCSFPVLAWGSAYGGWPMFVALVVGILVVVVLVLAAVATLRLLLSTFDDLAVRLGGEISSYVPRGTILLGTRIGRVSALHSLVSRLALITRLNLPLPAALEAAASGESYWVRRALRILRRRIIAGESVSKALPTSFPGFPPHLTAALVRAEQCGQLAGALTELERTLDLGMEIRLSTTAHIRHAAMYGVFMVLFVGMILAGFMTFLVPKFRQVFEDFETPLPSATRALLGVCDFVGGRGLTLLVAALGCVAALIALGVVERLRPGAVSGFVARVRAMLPVARSLDFSLGISKVIRSLLLEVRTGNSLSSSESLPAVVSATNPLRFRLKEFSDRLRQGVTSHEAAQASGLGDVLVRALRMVERGDDPETVLSHAANYHEAIAYCWWQRIGALAGPAVSLALGLLIGFVAYAMFVPLVALIQSVAETI